VDPLSLEEMLVSATAGVVDSAVDVDAAVDVDVDADADAAVAVDADVGVSPTRTSGCP